MVEPPTRSSKLISVLTRYIDSASRRPESELATDEHRWIVSRVIQDALGEDDPGTAYGQQLWEVLDRWDTGDQTIGILPRLTCEANGGDLHLAAPVTVAWRLARLAAKLFDDVEDGEASGQPAEVINTAIGLLFVAHLALDGPVLRGVNSGLVRRLAQAFDRATLRACAGQHADLAASRCRTTNVSPEAWLEIVGAKSGELLAWAAWAGALVAGADEHTLACYHEYGYHLGVLLQVADDFDGVWHPEDASDLATGQLTLPVCYGLAVAKAEERDCLKALLKQTAQGDEAAGVRARQLLTDLGAQAYLLVVGRVHHRQTVEALRGADSASPAGQRLVALPDRILPALSLSTPA
jgi:hypothetical protein